MTEWYEDPDVLSWDWREQPDLDRLATLLARHGVTATEVDTGSDQYAIRITPVSPEPPTPPAQPPGGRRAAAGPHPDTPDRAAALRRALLAGDDARYVFLATPDGRWSNPHWGEMARAEIEEEVAGEVMEVLLVSPAAGRVLDAARRVAGLDIDWQDWRQVAAAHRELRGAVDALDGDQPAEPGPAYRTGGIVRGGEPLIGGKHPSSGPENRTYQGSGGSSRSSAPEPAPRRYARADEFPCGSPHPEGGVTCRLLPHDGGTHARPASGGWDAWTEPAREPDPAGSRQTADQRGPGQAAGSAGEPSNTAAPEPDSGPGWNRVWLLDCMVTSLPGASYNEPDLHDEARRQVLALLADRDRLERLGHEYEGMHRQKMAWEREAHRLRAELATARRDAARSTLNYAGLTASSVMERDRLLRLAEDFGSGTRPVPGSPQPAPTSREKATDA